MAKKVVGKSSGWLGPVVEYRKNKGSVGKKRIVFVGASYLFVHKVLRDCLLVGGFEDVDLVVHDVDPEPLKIVADLLERIARQKKTRIRVFRTLDRKEALKGADAVILSITIGGREADFRSFEACAKYGIPVGVGDTLGPPALARCLREVPVVVAIARDMEKLCPNAILLNFSNPMSVITGVVGRTTSITCWGLCHSADSLREYMCDIFKCKPADVAMKVAGVNHQSFVFELKIKGVDRTKDILDASLKSAASYKDRLVGMTHTSPRLQQDIYRMLGAWPSETSAHLAEFYHFFYTPRRIEELDLASHLHRIIPGRKPFGRRPCPQIILDWAYGPEPVGDLHLLTSEHAHELLWSVFTGQSFTRALNLLNTGDFIQRLPKDACVEVMVTTAGKKVTGPSLELPPALHSTVERWTTIHDLSIQAALNCDREAARHALFLDPHVRDLYDIEPLLDDILKATEEWLPKKWFA